jgi:hypothetical protein
MTENSKRDHLGDLFEEFEEQITDSDELEALHRVDNLVVTAFDPLTGKVTCDPATNLAPVYKGMLYVDADDTEHEILGGISNVTGDKFFFVNKLDEVDFSDVGYIKSSLDYKQYELKGVSADVRLVHRSATLKML